MRKTIGILAHVDAGKTTLSEAVLYHGKAIRAKGRVDYRDSFLDADAVEKQRGITVFSGQAAFSSFPAAAASTPAIPWSMLTAAFWRISSVMWV